MTPRVFTKNKDGSDNPVASLPETGITPAAGCLPVTLNQGADCQQSYVAVPIYDASNPATIVVVVARNPNRRYLKIINQGGGDVELWTGSPPDGSTNKNPGQTPRRGEYLPPNGGGLVENGERISVIYATVTGSATGLLVIEG